MYEQRLIREAVVERTGKRFLDGLSSDEEMFRYLMDNSITSKDALNLSPGVALTAEQVAALTHDIVWMEPRELNGEHVLVPVLYLAHANDRLAPNGTLIQGQDVALITGGDLKNQGTLRASSDLQTIAGNVENSGLMQATEHLSLLATESIRNALGGIIKGGDVSANALTGNLINERTVGTTKGQNGGYTWSLSTADNAARIEAGNTLDLAAGLSVLNVGGALQAGGDARVTAGGNLLITAAEEVDSSSGRAKRAYWSQSQITQHGSDVQVGGNLSASAGGDLSVIASTIKAGEDVQLNAAGNVTIASAANESHAEYHRKGGGKKIDKVDDTVRQQSSLIEAGGALDIDAGKNLRLSASQLKAGDEAYLYAGDQLSLEAAQNSDYHLYDYQKKGSFGSKKTQRDEVTDVKHVGSQITTGGNLMLVSEGNQLYQAAKLDSGMDITLDSGGSITFEAVKDLHQESHEKSSSSLAWVSMSGKGSTDERIQQSVLVAQGQMAINAANGINIDIKQVDQQTISQAINAMVTADPQLAWLKDAEKRGDVDWRLVREVHDSYKYSHSSLGPGAMIAIAIVITVLTAGSGTAIAAASSASSTATNAALAAGFSQATAVSIGAAAAAATTAAMSAAMSQAVISTINKKGNIGEALKNVTSPDSLKGYMVSGLVAGFAAGVLDKAFGVTSENVGKATHGFDLSKLDGFTKYAGYTLTENAFAATVNSAINGGSLKNALAQAAIGTVADSLSASIYNKLGARLEFSGLPAKVAAHALVGGLIAELAGGDFNTGALAAGANEAFVATVGDAIFQGNAHDQLLALTSQLIGMSVVAVAGGSDKDQAISGWVASQATRFNSLDHPTAEKLLNDIKDCKASNTCSAEKIRGVITSYEKLSAERSARIDACKTVQCVEAIRANTIAMDDPVAKDLLDLFKRSVSYDMAGLLTGDPSKLATPSQGVDPWGATFVTDDQLIFAKYIKEGWLIDAEMDQLEVWDSQTDWIDRAVGRKLTLQEKASSLLELTTTAAIGIIGGRGTLGTKGVIKSSETIGKPVEAVINGRKRLLRVDIEPNGKLQIQSGGGKDSIVDFRPDLSKPLGPQISQAFKRLPKSAIDQLIKNAEKGLKRLQETGNM